MRIFEQIKDVNVPILKEGQLYIYVLENAPQGNFKIGKSSNMQQRLQALSGSNTGGNRIVRCAVSDPTYLYTLENIIQNKFASNRIEGTEWFVGEGLSFQEITSAIDELFKTQNYTRCNEIRRDFVKQQLSKGNKIVIPQETEPEEE